MSAANDIHILGLKRHRDNLLAADSWEEYRDAHVAYVNFLINMYTAKYEADEVVLDWIEFGK